MPPGIRRRVRLDILERIDDPHYTTELGLFNLEINLDPLVFEGGLPESA